MGLEPCDALVDALDDPAFLVHPNGEITFSNQAALKTLEARREGGRLTDLVVSSPDDLVAFLRRCSGTAQPLPGSASFRLADGSISKYRLRGARLSMDGTPRVLVRCLNPQRGEFPVLAAKVRELNAEIHIRRRMQEALEEALRNNEVLLRELHHRVKNNLQMLIGLMSGAQRECSNEEARTILQEAVQRLTAIGSLQNLMHASEEIRAVSSANFIHAICDAASATIGEDFRIAVSAEDHELDNDMAMPLALILNELLTNAAKHAGGSDGSGVRVQLSRLEQEWELVVHDNGPGLPPDHGGRRSSGLGLVTGLCRQIGASMKIENSDGARFILRFGGATQ